MRGKIITLLSPKGGVGKTTLGRILALMLRRYDYRVAVIDCDPNRKMFKWLNFAQHEGKPFLPQMVLCPKTPEDVIDIAITLANGGAIPGEQLAGEDTASLTVQPFDFVLIDTAGFGNQAAVYATGTSDLALIPTGPTDDDIGDSVQAAKTVRSSSSMTKRDIAHFIVLNRVKAKTKVAEHAIGEMEKLNLPIFGGADGKPIVFEYLAPYAEMTFNRELPLHDLKARRECDRFTDAVLEALGSPKPLERAA